MGPSHVGIGLQNHQNQCSIQASSMNRLNRTPIGRQLVEPVEKNYEILTEGSLKNKESMKKNGVQFRGRMRDMTKTSPSALNLDLLPCILPKLKLWGPVEPVEKNCEILTKFSLKNKEFIKKIVCNSEFG